MEASFIKDAQKEREEWLAGFGLDENAVEDDDEGAEFIRLEPTGARLYLPQVIQSVNLTY